MSSKDRRTNRFREEQQLVRSCGLRLTLQKQLNRKKTIFQAWDTEAGLLRIVRIIPFDSAAKQCLRTMRRSDDHEELVPGIIYVRETKGKLVLVSKWIEGQSLRQYLDAAAAGRVRIISLHQSVMLFRKFVTHLSSLHRSGLVVHGDIKPSNLVVSRRRVWKLMLIDFGSAWGVENTVRRKLGDGITPVYAAPECQDPSKYLPNYLSDQFSASVVFYEMLTGEIPFDRLGGTVGSTEISLRPPSVQLADTRVYPRRVLKAVDDLVMKGLALSPDNRFAKSGEWQAYARSAEHALEIQKPVAASDWLGECWKMIKGLIG